MSRTSRRGLLKAGTVAGLAGVASLGTVEAVVGPSPAFSASPPDAGTWPGARYGPRNTGHDPVATGPDEDPAVDWTTVLDAKAWRLHAVGDLLLAAQRDVGRVVALDASTGDVRWRHRVGGRFGTVALWAGEPIFVAGDGAALALDRAGDVRWRTDVDGRHPTDVVVGDGTVYAGEYGRYGGDAVHAVDADTGERVWRREFGTAVPNPIVVRDVLYVAAGTTVAALR